MVLVDQKVLHTIDMLKLVLLHMFSKVNLYLDLYQFFLVIANQYHKHILYHQMYHDQNILSKLTIKHRRVLCNQFVLNYDSCD